MLVFLWKINSQYTPYIHGLSMMVSQTIIVVLFGMQKYALKNKFFLRLVRQNKILTKVNLAKRGWQCDVIVT